MLNVELIVVIGVQLAGVALVLFQLRQHRKYIGSLHSDANRPKISPEIIVAWEKKLATLSPGSKDHAAYKRAIDGCRHPKQA